MKGLSEVNEICRVKFYVKRLKEICSIRNFSIADNLIRKLGIERKSRSLHKAQ